jgi:hypothetical protein
MNQFMGQRLLTRMQQLNQQYYQHRNKRRYLKDCEQLFNAMGMPELFPDWKALVFLNENDLPPPPPPPPGRRRRLRRVA